MTEQQDMGQFMDEIEKSMMSFAKGDIIKGKVVNVGKEDVIVNIGHMSDGVISKSELSYDGSLDPSTVVKEGDEIDVYVLKISEEQGQVLLSKKRADQVVVWDELIEAMNSKTAIEVTINKEVKGGVVTFIKGVRAFIPASQLSVRYVEDMSEFVGKTLMVRVMEVNKEKKNVILSRKEIELVEKEDIKEKLWSELSVGDVLKGEVKKLENFGAFIDIGGIDGLAHISALSWRRVKHPSEILSVGDVVDTEILELQKDKDRIGLKVLNAQQNPWNNISSSHKVGSVVSGEVVRLTDFGAFIQLDSGIEGLVHISQISDDHIKHPKDVLEKGQKVDVKILNINTAEQKISLSIKEAKDDKIVEQNVEEFSNQGNASVTLGDIFGDKLSDFFK